MKEENRKELVAQLSHSNYSPSPSPSPSPKTVKGYRNRLRRFQDKDRTLTYGNLEVPRAAFIAALPKVNRWSQIGKHATPCVVLDSLSLHRPSISFIRYSLSVQFHLPIVEWRAEIFSGQLDKLLHSSQPFIITYVRWLCTSTTRSVF